MSLCEAELDLRRKNYPELIHLDKDVNSVYLTSGALCLKVTHIPPIAKADLHGEEWYEDNFLA